MWRLRTDGRRQPLLAHVAVVNDPDGNASEIVHSFRDITKLKEADAAKTMFLATASHELKTPLTVIQGFGQTLLRMPDWSAEERDEAIRTMVRRTKELNRIVERLLMSSRIEAGRSDVAPMPLRLEPIVAERAAAFARATHRDVVFTAEHELPDAMADTDALTTVVDHLIENALKYSAPPARVRVSLRSDDRFVLLEVHDEGIGMDPEQAAHCFERFWQAESSDSRRYGGTGIGLFIVRSVVEAMGGKVTVSTQLGKGSSFTVSLPRAEVGVPVAFEPERVRPPAHGGEPSVIREFMRQIGVPSEARR